jgi:uncharacterized protein (DUF1330 family)
MRATKAFLVSETETLDPAILADYAPKVQAALRNAGGRPAVISSVGGQVIGLVGQPPANYVVSEWESAAAAQAWLVSVPYKALEPQRSRAYRIHRQFIIAMAVA